MANYVELNGIHTWYDEQGTGEPLVLLHPGGVGVDSRAFEPNLPVVRHLGREPIRPQQRVRQPPGASFDLAQRLRQPAGQAQIVKVAKDRAVFLP